jgi:ribonucleoside-diphosphate reductase alpha chain
MLKKRNGTWEPDFEKIRRTVREAVHFLDNVIDRNHYPLPQIAEMAKGNRKIGLGVMGLAHFFIRLGIPYHTPKAIEVVRGIMSFIQHQARERSIELAEERGVFPNFKGSIYDRPGGMKLRNATLTTIAPTGTLSLLANCSGGIEPLFAMYYTRKALEGMEFQMMDPLFLEIAEEQGFMSEQLVQKLREGKELHELPEVPQSVKDLFVTSFDIPAHWHVKVQAGFQEFTDNAVSKTINFSREATQKEVQEAFLMAYREKCKGITIYRSGSKPGQVLACGTRQVC